MNIEQGTRNVERERNLLMERYERKGIMLNVE